MQPEITALVENAKKIRKTYLQIQKRKIQRKSKTTSANPDVCDSRNTSTCSTYVEQNVTESIKPVENHNQHVHERKSTCVESTHEENSLDVGDCGHTSSRECVSPAAMVSTASLNARSDQQHVKTDQKAVDTHNSKFDDHDDDISWNIDKASD